MKTRCNTKPCSFQSRSILDEINDKYPEANGNSKSATEMAATKLENLYNYMMRINTGDRGYVIDKKPIYASDGTGDWLAEKAPINAPSADKIKNEEDILSTELFFYRGLLVDGPGNIARISV